jgi:hypothetical protein
VGAPAPGWQQDSLTAITQAPSAASAPPGSVTPQAPPGASAPSAYVTRDGTARVVYKDSNGDIIEMYLAPGQPWQVDTLSTLSTVAGAPPAASAPSGYVTPDGTARVIYRDVNGGITEMYLTPGQPWQQDTLSAITQAPPAASAPFGYVTPDGTARVIYQDSNGGINELRL